MTITVPKQKKTVYILITNSFYIYTYDLLPPNKTEYKLRVILTLTTITVEKQQIILA